MNINSIDNFYEKLKEDKRKFFSMLVFGARNTGKSYMIKDFLYQTREFYNEIYLVSKTGDKQYYLWNFIPQENIISSFDVELITSIIKKQSSFIISKMNEYKVKHPDSSDDKIKEYKSKLNHIVFVFDDFISDGNVRKSNNNPLDYLYMAGRHDNISVISLVQEMMSKGGISKLNRRNSDIVVMFGGKSEQNKKMICEEFLSANSKKEGMKIYTDIINVKYQCCICFNYINSADITDYVFKYVAKETNPFFIGKQPKKIVERNHFEYDFTINRISEKTDRKIPSIY